MAAVSAERVRLRQRDGEIGEILRKARGTGLGTCSGLAQCQTSRRPLKHGHPVLIQFSCPLAPSHGRRLSLQGILRSLEEPQSFRGLTPGPAPHLPLSFQSCISPGTDPGTTGDCPGNTTGASYWEERRSLWLLGFLGSYANKP